MAKKIQEEPTQPKISQLPLPATDTPVVIDLPDGQKLVIGQLASGSVIEVATWRGTGRPDSRTSRLMIGMSGGSVNSPSGTTEIVEDIKAPTEGWAKVIEIVRILPRALIFIAKKVSNLRERGSLARLNPFVVIGAVKEKSKSSVAVVRSVEVDENVAPKTEKVSSPNSLTNINSSDDVDAWLDSVMEKSRRAAKKPPAKKVSASKPKPRKKSSPKSIQSKKR